MILSDEKKFNLNSSDDSYYHKKERIHFKSLANGILAEIKFHGKTDILIFYFKPYE